MNGRFGTRAQHNRARVPAGGLWTGTGVLSMVLQAAVLFMTGVMGLGWGGVTYAVANLQAVLGFCAIVVLVAGRRRWWALGVPVISALLTFGLVMLGESLGETGP